MTQEIAILNPETGVQRTQKIAHCFEDFGTDNPEEDVLFALPFIPQAENVIHFLCRYKKSKEEKATRFEYTGEDWKYRKRCIPAILLNYLENFPKITKCFYTIQFAEAKHLGIKFVYGRRGDDPEYPSYNAKTYLLAFWSDTEEYTFEDLEEMAFRYGVRMHEEALEDAALALRRVAKDMDENVKAMINGTMAHTLTFPLV